MRLNIEPAVGNVELEVLAELLEQFENVALGFLFDCSQKEGSKRYVVHLNVVGLSSQKDESLGVFLEALTTL